MVQSPRFARGLFVAADGQHDHVRLFGDIHGFRDLLAVFVRIAGHDCVLVPVAADGNFAAFAEKHFGAAANLGLNAVQDGDIVLGHSAVATEQTAMGVRANDRIVLTRFRSSGTVLPAFRSKVIASRAARRARSRWASEPTTRAASSGLT